MTDPEFDMSSIDVVTDRNNICKLLPFVDLSLSRNSLEPFAVKLEITKNIVIFSRTATKNEEIVRPHHFKDFGHEFEKAYITCEIGDSTGHHRIVSYKFGGQGVFWHPRTVSKSSPNGHELHKFFFNRKECIAIDFGLSED